MADGPISGDIRDLYAYYRFSDYAKTNIVLKNKLLKKEPVWFEGYMDFSFKTCIFKQPIYWGVEGARLSEDTRGTDENDNTFPIYGSNGLNFDDCTFYPDSSPVTIHDNCVAVFINCTFIATGVVDIGNNCRVEFIDCTFTNWQFNIADYSDVRMRRCEWASPQYHAKVTNGSQLTCHDCVYNSAGQFSMEADGDSKIVLSNHEPQDVAVGQYMYKITDKSSIDLYNFGTLTCPMQVLLVDDSKVKGRKIDLMNAVLNCIEETNGSEIFLRDVKEIISASMSALFIDNSLFRLQTNEKMEGLLHAVDATESFVNIKEYDELIGKISDAIWGDRTNFRVFEGNIIRNLAEAAGIYLTGESKSLFKDNREMIQGQFYGLDINDEAEIIVDTAVLIRGLILHGIIYQGNPSIECVDVDTIRGLIHGIIGDTATLRINRNSIETWGETENGMVLSNTLYDFKDVDYIHGLLKGAILTNCKGIVNTLREIYGETEEGLVLMGMAGPTEWINVDLIWSPVMQGLIFTGDAAQSRFSGIKDIHSEVLEGVIWTQSGGMAVFTNCGEIYSIPESGLEIHISEGAILEMNTVEKIYSTDKHAIEGDVSGIFVATIVQEISSSNGDIVKINGSGALDSMVKFKTIESMRTNNAPDDGIKIADIATIILEDIEDITVTEAAQYAVRLQGLGPGYGTIKALDCKSITSTKARAGLVVRNALLADVVGIKEPCKIVIDEAEIYGFGAVNTNLFLRNYDEITVSDGEGFGVYLYNLGLQACVQKVLNVTKISTKKRATIHAINSGTVEVIDIERLEISDDGDAFHGEGEGTFIFKGNKGRCYVKAKDDSQKAISIKGNAPAWVEIARISVELGKLDFEKVAYRLRGCEFRDYSGTEDSGHLYGCTFDTQELFEGTESSMYLFKSEITGAGNVVLTDSTMTVDVSTISTTGDAFTGTNSSTILGDTSTFDCINMTAFKAARFNACMGKTDIECQGVIINGCSFTGKMTSGGNYRGGYLINGSYVGPLEVTEQGALLMNGTHSQDEIKIATETGIILNKAYFSGSTDIGDGNAIISNHAQLRDLTIGNGNVLVANRTTIGGVTAGELNTLAFNYCIPTSAGFTVGDNCALELNGISAPGASVSLGQTCGFLVNRVDLNNLTVPSTSSVLASSANFSGAIGLGGDLVASGLNIGSTITGWGRLIATHKRVYPDAYNPPGVSAGLMIRGEHYTAQAIIWADPDLGSVTKGLWGYNANDAQINASGGRVYVTASGTAILSGSGGNNAVYAGTAGSGAGLSGWAKGVAIVTTSDTITEWAYPNGNIVHKAGTGGIYRRAAGGTIEDSAAIIIHDPPV